MINTQHIKSYSRTSILATTLLTLMACNSSDEGSGEGFVKLYNLSKDAPNIYLTLDEDISVDADSDNDHYENTYAGIAYTKANSNFSLETNNYDYQLAWQDGDNSSSENLNLIHEGQLTVTDDNIKMIVLSNSILSPDVMVYDIPVIDDDSDDDDDLFNMRVLNMHPGQVQVDFYYSTEDETFAQAQLFSQVNYQELTENQKIAQESYIFYITEAGNDEVLFQSHSINFAYSSQYVIALRENLGAGSSPFVIDKLSNSSITEYVDDNAETTIRAYNAVAPHSELNSYQGNLSLYVNGIDETPEIPLLSFGEISSELHLTSGDYSLDLVNTQDEQPLLSNHLISLNENTNKTVFFYAEEEYVDSDGDGNIDENGDGIIDEIDVNLYSLVVNNSLSTSIYEHEIEIVNLVQSDEFDQVQVYFVRSDETIDTALYHRTIKYKETNEISLQNNSYQVFVIAQENGSRIILNSFELLLDEQSTEQFLVLEVNETSATGYKASLIDQVLQQESDNDD